MTFDVTPPSDDPVFPEMAPPLRLSSVAEREPDGLWPDPVSREEGLQRIWESDRSPSLVMDFDDEDDELSGDRELGIPAHRRIGPYVIGAVIAAIVGVVLAVLYLNFISGTGTRAAPEDLASAPAVASPPAAGVIGEPLRVGTLAFKVHGIREVPATAEERPAPGTRWVAVEVEVVNEGTGAAEISPFEMFDLLDGAGASYGPTIIGSVARNAEGTLAPGLRLQGEVVFEVPQSAGEFVLVITTPDRARTGRVTLS